MRIFIIFLLTVTSFPLLAQDNVKFKTDHRNLEAQLKARALDRFFQSNQFLANESGRGYDVNYYRLSLNLSPAETYMEGVVKVDATVKDQALSEIKLDFNSFLTVDSTISVNGNLSYTQGDGSLKVLLERAYTLDEQFSFTIYYHGRTDFGGQSVFGVSFGQTEIFGRPHIWSLSEPYGARDWWPCKDTPLDKADSMDIIYTVPEGMSAAGNGKLISELTSDGKTTFHWKVNYPIATYLVSIAAYEYQRYQDEYISQSGDTLPIMFFVAPENYAGSLQNFGMVNSMIQIYSDLFGEYPFMGEKYGHAEASIGGGMEHQTITTLGPIQYYGGIYSEGLIAHELAHQWWGDMITCASFHDIWLNEGFATYSEALLVERLSGFDEYKKQMAGETYYGGGTIYVQDTTDSGVIFNSQLSYSKAAYVLHMLRGVVGDQPFFDIMHTWYDNASTKYRSAYTEDFQKVCEEVSGKNLDKFFQQWIYGAYYPVYAYGYNYEAVEGGYNVTIGIDQRQDNTGLFWMPIDMRLYTAHDTINFTVWDSLSSQQFTRFVKEEPTGLVLDPDSWILKKTQDKLINPTFDKGTLLVNGMNWIISGVPEAYENYAFWGTAPITFWDVIGEPSAGYPGSLPVAQGQGELKLTTLGEYSTIIWLSSNTTSDRQNWQKLPMAEYLNQGGNIILITQSGSTFIDSELKEYLGISWDEQNDLLIQDFESTYPGLWEIGLSESMSSISAFDTVVTKETSTLLYKTGAGFNASKGVGVWSNPTQGGDFVYLAARPWRMDHYQLKTTMLYILQNFMKEPVVSLKTTDNLNIPLKFEITRIYPNPFNPSTRIDFSLPEQCKVTAIIYDIIGRQVAEIVKDISYDPGEHTIQWNAENLASGIYFFQLRADELLNTRKVILMKTCIFSVNNLYKSKGLIFSGRQLSNAKIKLSQIPDICKI